MCPAPGRSPVERVSVPTVELGLEDPKGAPKELVVAPRGRGWTLNGG